MIHTSKKFWRCGGTERSGRIIVRALINRTRLAIYQTEQWFENQDDTVASEERDCIWLFIKQENEFVKGWLTKFQEKYSNLSQVVERVNAASRGELVPFERGGESVIFKHDGPDLIKDESD
jgi:hypothetical protein